MYPFDNSDFGEPIPELPPEYILQEIQRFQRDGRQKRPAPGPIPQLVPPRENFGGTNPIPLTNIPANVYDLPPRRPEPGPIPQLIPPSGSFGGTDPMRLSSVPPNIYDLPPNREQRMGLPPKPTFQSEMERLESVAQAREAALPQPPPPTPGLRPPNPYEQRYHQLLAQDPQKARAFMDAWVKENIQKQKSSPLAQAVQRGPLNGSTYGFGNGELSQGALDQIARTRANEARRGLTASQRRQVDTPIVKSGLQQALEELGTPADKNQRAFDKAGVAVPGGGKMFGSRTRVFQNPDGSVTLIGGKEFISGKDYTERGERAKGAKESSQVARRMEGVQKVIDRKNKMDDKLAANRALAAAENKLKKNPAMAFSEPKNAAEAGIQAVTQAVAQNKFLDKESRVALFQAARDGFNQQKALDADLAKQKLQNQGFGNTAFAEILKVVAPGIMTNPDNSFVSPEEMQQRLQQVGPLIARMQAMLTELGGDGLNLPPLGDGGGAIVTIPPVVTEKTAGMTIPQAEAWMTENNYPLEVKEKRLAEMEKTATPKEIEDAKNKIDNNRAGRRTVPVKKDRRPPLSFSRLFGSLGEVS